MLNTLPSFHRAAIKAVVLLLAALGGTSVAWGANDIVIGQSLDFGPTSWGRLKEFTRGSDALVTQVNAGGGIKGRKIKLIRYDDQFKPDKALENAKKLVEVDKVDVLFAFGSAPNFAATIPYATKAGVPVFGAISGADSIRKFNPLLFHYRASFSDEVNRMVQHVSGMGIKTMGVLAVDLPIGKDGLAALNDASKAGGSTLKVVASEKIPQDLKGLDAAVANVIKANPATILILGPSGPAIKFIEALKKTTSTAQIFVLSVVSSDALVAKFGEAARGIVITQVVPYPWVADTKLVKDYQDLMNQTRGNITVDSMEGYLAARMLIEGIRASGANFSRKGFVSALEKWNNKDMDGYSISFSDKDHVASSYVDITMIGKQGRLVR